MTLSIAGYRLHISNERTDETSGETVQIAAAVYDGSGNVMVESDLHPVLVAGDEGSRDDALTSACRQAEERLASRLVAAGMDPDDAYDLIATELDREGMPAW